MQITTDIDRIFTLLYHYYAYQVFGDDSDLLPAYSTSIPEDEHAYRLALVGYSIALTPAMIALFMKEPAKFPRFRKLIFGEPICDQRCLGLVTDYIAKHNLARHPSYEEKLELTRKLLLVDSFRYHHFKQYFLTPIWIYAIRCRWTTKSVKARAAKCMTGMTTSVKSVLLGGMGTFAIMEQNVKELRYESSRLISHRGYLAMTIGVVSHNQSAHAPKHTVIGLI
jgi:hypothetical protein